MYKSITAFVLLAVFSLQILNRVVIYIDYYSNTAVYAENCENKALPEMHCNGKCQMEKKMVEQEKNHHHNQERKIINDEVISSRSFFAGVTNTALVVHLVYNNFKGSELQNMPRSFFHPPGA